MTINVTPVNDAPAGANKTVDDRSKTRGYAFAAADFGFSDPIDSPANALARGEDHDAAGRRHADATTASRSPPARSSSAADIAAGKLRVHARRRTERRAATRASPSRCRTTAARPTAAWTSIRRANTMTINVTAVNDAPAGRTTRSTTLRGHARTPSPRPTSASAIRRRPATRSLAVRITTLPALGALTLNGVAGRRGADRLGGRHRRRQAACSRRPRTRTAPATRASPSRCRTTAARPTAASISIRPRNTITSTSRRSTTRRPAPTTTVTTLEDTPYVFAAADFGFSDADDSPANALAGGEDRDAARCRHAHQQRRRR